MDSSDWCSETTQHFADVFQGLVLFAFRIQLACFIHELSCNLVQWISTSLRRDDDLVHLARWILHNWGRCGRCDKRGCCDSLWHRQCNCSGFNAYGAFSSSHFCCQRGAGSEVTAAGGACGWDLLMVLIVLKLLESLAAQNLFPDWIFHGLHLNCVTHSRTGQASVWFQSKRCHHEQSQDECSGSTLPTFPTAGLFSWLTWAQHALQVRIWHLNCWFSEEVHGWWGQSFHTCNTIKQKALTQTYFEPKNIQRIRKAGCLVTEESCGANRYSISRLQLELQKTVNWPGIHCHHDQQEPLAMLLSRYGMITATTEQTNLCSFSDS